MLVAGQYFLKNLSASLPFKYADWSVAANKPILFARMTTD
jgi:hypothetical protein